MSCKTESLYTKVMEWLRAECPLLQPENMSVDFELAILNTAEEVFQVIPTGCDFHYNQAIYRKFGKLGLKPILTQNANFGKWAYQIMALNHLPSDQIEPTFRELCSQEFPLGDTNKSLKSKFQKYWEKFWLNTIGVERLSVYKAPLRTNSHCENYHSRLAKTIGI